jgi:hypothetical protein
LLRLNARNGQGECRRVVRLRNHNDEGVCGRFAGDLGRLDSPRTATGAGVEPAGLSCPLLNHDCLTMHQVIVANGHRVGSTYSGSAGLRHLQRHHIAGLVAYVSFGRCARQGEGELPEASTVGVTVSQAVRKEDTAAGSGLIACEEHIGVVAFANPLAVDTAAVGTTTSGSRSVADEFHIREAGNFVVIKSPAALLSRCVADELHIREAGISVVIIKPAAVTGTIADEFDIREAIVF